TPSGAEVYRTISPREPSDYIAMLSQVAQQQGVGVARQWTPGGAQGTGDRGQETGFAAAPDAGQQPWGPKILDWQSRVAAVTDTSQQQWRAAPQQEPSGPQGRPSPVEQVRQERQAWAGVNNAEAPSQSPID